MHHKVEFRGATGEYFGIWIVNVLLTLITFGIYGAWAKVRDKTYFYNNTIIDNHSFDYHATGLQIFIGRVIVIMALILLSILNYVSITAYLIGVLVLLILIPFIVVRALRFNARVTSYRNVRFDFLGKAGQAFVTYVLIPIGNVFTLYLCTPFVSRASHKFVTNNSTYGDRPFKFHSDIGNYYAPFFIAMCISAFGFVALSMLLGGTMSSLMGDLANASASEIEGDLENNPVFLGFILAIYLGMILVFVPAVLFYKAWIRNILFNHTVLDDKHALNSTVNPGRYVWIVISNTALALVSVGLMIPWGRVRLAKYMASVTEIESDDPLDGYTSSVKETSGVVSSEYMELEGFDINIGI